MPDTEYNQVAQDLEEFKGSQERMNRKFFAMHEQHQRNHEALALRADKNFEKLSQSNDKLIEMVDRQQDILKSHEQLMIQDREDRKSLAAVVQQNTESFDRLSVLIPIANTSRAFGTTFGWLAETGKKLLAIFGAAAIIYALYNGTWPNGG